VFKRDQFRCQYCGASAPDVVLVIDHIRPVVDGGDDSLLNLLTSCEPCNAGKSDVALSDGAAVKKQLAQVRNLAERREQMQMLVEWRDGLLSIEDETLNLVIERIDARLTPLKHHVGEARERVRSWIKKFGLNAVLYGVQQATDSSSAVRLFDQMEQYAGAQAKVEREPELRDFWRIRARLRGRGFSYGREWEPIQDMRQAFRHGWTIVDMDTAAGEADDYEHFLRLIGFR
jgi:hypothetical protein